jgi:hypothetical protein
VRLEKLPATAKRVRKPAAAKNGTRKNGAAAG